MQGRVHAALQDVTARVPHCATQNVLVAGDISECRIAVPKFGVFTMHFSQ
jgi:hypothetical protein